MIVVVVCEESAWFKARLQRKNNHAVKVEAPIIDHSEWIYDPNSNFKKEADLPCLPLTLERGITQFLKTS